MKVYELRSVNMSGVGLAMGLQHTSTNWRRFFKSIAKAKKAAEKDYLDQKPDPAEPMQWHKSGAMVSSQDLRFVMYEIAEVKVEG